VSAAARERVVWHDVECGAYDADLPLWRELARAAAGPVLDVGAGTGRVALDLAARGHEVVALDRDPALLDALQARAGGLPVAAVPGDMRAFALGRRFALVIVPMQTIQLLTGPAQRAEFLACARRHCVAGAWLAMALADPLEGMAPADEPHELPLPDVREIDGVVYASQPVAVRAGPAGTEIERIRQRVAANGSVERTDDVVRVTALAPGDLEREADAAGLSPLPRRTIAPTPDHVGSTVVVAAAP
jgi:SAM-dependent methyltransferase